MTDAELIEYASDFRAGILDGEMPTLRCFMVCAPLATLLNMDGVACELVESDLGWANHFWLRLADGRALDPTADQFNYLDSATPPFPPVYLGAPTKYHAALPRPPKRKNSPRARRPRGGFRDR